MSSARRLLPALGFVAGIVALGVGLGLALRPRAADPQAASVRSGDDRPRPSGGGPPPGAPDPADPPTPPAGAGDDDGPGPEVRAAIAAHQRDPDWSGRLPGDPAADAGPLGPTLRELEAALAGGGSFADAVDRLRGEIAGDDRLLEAALDALARDPREVVLAMISRALRGSDDPRVLETAGRLLADDAVLAEPRRAAAVLGIVAGAEAAVRAEMLGELVGRVAESRPVVAAAALEALAGAPGQSDPLTPAAGRLRPTFREHAPHPDELVRAAALRGLAGWSDDPADRHRVIAAVRHDASAVVRRAATRAAAASAALGHDDAADALCALLADPGEEPEVRRAAIAAVDELPQDRIVPRLREARARAAAELGPPR